METSVVLSVSENLQIESIIHTVNITDKRNLERIFEYGITSGNSQQKFAINSMGELYVADSLDFEETSSYLLNVVVKDATIDPLSSESAMTTIEINVLDFNDNAPQFSMSEYLIKIDEDIAINSTIIDLNPTDADSNNNALLNLTVLNSNLFGIRSNGEVFTLQKLDYETQVEHNVSVVAADNGNPSLSTTVQLIVTLNNVNDVRPVLNATSYDSLISEASQPGTTVVLTVSATDMDTPISELTYEINGTTSFTVNSSGSILLAEELDYEMTNVYVFEVIVNDGVVNTDPLGTAEITVKVTDVNDNAPVFPYSDGTVFTVLENTTIHSTVLNASATDVDSHTITYSLEQNDSGTFYITADGLLKLNTSIDRENTLSYSLTLTATDGELSSNLQVTILVGDVNDNVPQIVNVSSQYILESTPINDVIAVIKAIDADIGENAAIQFSLISGDDIPFAITDDSGQLTLAQALDYESRQIYSFNVTVSDNGEPVLSSSIVYTVIVLDENDNAPNFTQNTFTASIPETIDVGSFVIQLNSTDEDFEDANTYTEYIIESGNSDQNFRINSTTGQVYVQDMLDFETQSVYELVVIGNNSQAQPPLTGSAHLIVELINVNEFPPEFDQDVYEFSVLENLPEGHVIQSIIAKDNDTGQAGISVYSISPEGSPFAIQDGNLVTEKMLDRENVASYELEITAMNSVTPFFLASAMIIITVNDINDNAPMFLASLYKATIAENTPSGQLLSLIPPLNAQDFDLNSEITYSITDTSVFQINLLTGEILVNGDIDYEENTAFNFSIVASDNGNTSLSSSVQLRITVTNENDNSPVVTGLENLVTFVEGSDTVNLAPLVNITDEDSLDLVSLTVRLLDKNQVPSTLPGSLSFSDPSLVIFSLNNDRTLVVNGPFSVSVATDILRTVQYQNTEPEPDPTARYFQVTVNDGIHELTSELTKVEIELVNDNTPTLSINTDDNMGNFETVFVENGSPVSVTSSSISIEDKDEANSPYFSLNVDLLTAPDSEEESLQISSAIANDFQVSYSSLNHSLIISGNNSYDNWISILQSITYYNSDDNPSTYPERLIRFVLSDSAHNSIAVNSTITIIPVNDAPVLRLSATVDYDATFVEGRGQVALTSVTDFSLLDKDSAMLFNATITLTNPQVGDIEYIDISTVGNTETVSIQKSSHSIVISGMANVSVYSQLLSMARYYNEEETPSSAIRSVVFTVHDGELESIATTSVSFSSVNDPPVVDLNGDNIGLNYDTVFNEDGPAIPAFSSSLTVHDVDSSTLAYAIVTLIPASDDVSMEGIGITESNDVLSISGSPSNYTISGSSPASVYEDILKNLEYFNLIKEPTVLEKRISVVVSDGEKTSDKVYSNIIILLRNDIPVVNLSISFPAYPEESGSLSLSSAPSIVDDDNTTMEYIQVTLSGAVDGQLEVFQYSLPDGVIVDVDARVYTFTSTSNFGVEEWNELMRSFEYKHLSSEPTSGQRKLSVVANDGINSSQPFVVSILVTLSNDNTPQFITQNNSEVSVPENMQDIVVFTVTAEDDDSSTDEQYGFQGQIAYSIVSGNNDGIFELNSATGILKVVKSVNREAMLNLPNLIITARNPVPLENGDDFPNISLLISITDANDNAPVWENVTYEFEIAENPELGHVVGSVLATDLDSGVNSDISYSIVQSNTGFMIDPLTGKISVSEPDKIDRETTSLITITIDAIDGGAVPLQASTNVNINVLDVNDNPPSLSFNINVEVEEDIDIGQVFYTVVAVDPDNGVNGSLIYTLSDNSTFNINQTTGGIFAVMKLDREMKSNYDLVVTVSDLGTPTSLSTNSTVTINLLDINDNPPVFSQSTYSKDIFENEPSNLFVLVVSATDLDVGNSSMIQYSLSFNATSYFSIDVATGEIVSNDPFDAESTETFLFEVYASDNVFSATATVKIIVKDRNDNTPVFLVSTYEASVSEDESIDTSVLTVSAIDADISTSNITYSILSSKFSSFFNINPSNGVLSIQQNIDREEVENITLMVEAQDNGIPPASSVATVHIEILDINDNQPVFDSEIYNFTIAEGISNSILGTVYATDADVQENGQISYYIVTRNDTDHFKIDNVTGEIFVTMEIDRETSESYSFTIIAADGGSPSLNSSALVSVTVLDKNDNTPQFPQQKYQITLREDYALSSIFLVVDATDSDASEINSNIIYSILSEDDQNIFQIDSSTGALSLIAPLDAETEVLHFINVTARDTGTPSLSSTVEVYIYVTDVNDNEISVELSLNTIQFIEGGDNVDVFPDVIVMDIDENSVVVNATVLISGCNDCEGIRLIFNNDIASFTNAVLNVNTNQTELVFKGNFTNEEMTDILRNIQYENTLNELQSITQYVNLTLSDGIYQSEVSVTVDLARVNNHSPVIDLNKLDGEDSLDYSTQFIEANGGVLITLNPSITDDDSGPSVLENIEIQITNPFDDPLEILTAISNSDITVFPQSGGPMITLIGPAEASVFESVLSTVRYNNYHDNPFDLLPRIIQVIANDGTFVTEPSHVTVSIQPTNDPPIILLDGSNINTTANYIEDSLSIVLAPNAQLSDTDSSALEQMSIEIIQPLDDNFEYLIAPETQGLTVTVNTPTSIVYTGSDTSAVYQSVVKNLRYINNASEPTEGQRLVSIVVSDGENITEAFVLLNITARDDSPIVTITPANVTFTENGSAINVFPGIVEIIDVDSLFLSSVETKITNTLDGNEEYLFWNGSPDFIIIGNMSHTLTIQGSFSPETFATALSNVYYINTASSPSSGLRVVTVIANDGTQNSNPVEIVLILNVMNFPPKIVLDSFGNTNTNVMYLEESGSVSVIDTAAKITDEDSDVLSHLEVTLSPVIDHNQESVMYSIISDSLIVNNTFDSLTSTLIYNFSFPSSAQVNVFNQLLHSLEYVNSAVEPDDSTTRKLVITVNDNDQYSNAVTVAIAIALINDNQPLFLNSTYNFLIPENLPSNSTVGTVEAYDADKYSVFYYVIFTENIPFTIDELSGEIRTNEILDSEMKSEYELTIRLSISLEPISLFPSTATVYVIVSDVNEPPSFTQSMYEFTVLENITVGSKFGSVMADDLDSGNNSQLSYTVSSSLVGITEDTGVLFIAAPLDRENASSLVMTVIVTDNGIQPLSAEAQVKLLIADVNDNSPIFSSSEYNVQLLDNIAISTVILIVSAEDSDLGANSQLSYSLLSTDSLSFDINETSGVIFTTQLLSPGQFVATVVATDNGTPQLNGTALVTIDVYNSTNSSLLQFNQSVYTSSIVENSPAGTYLLTVTAMDPVFNSNLTYSLDNDELSIDTLSGEVFSNAVFDRETTLSVQATVLATSSDNLQVIAEIFVTILDDNDNPPVFVNQVYNFSVVEAAEIGHVIGNISANDFFDEGENAVVTNYTIDSNEFTINSNGNIIVSMELDRESKEDYFFNAYAIDGGSAPLTGTTLVSITIEDINDNAPVFTSTKYAGSVKEGQISTFVLTVTAIDSDLGENAKIKYSIDSPYFTINSVTGEIYTFIALDFENQPIHNFTVYATDNGSPSLNTSATIQIYVVNIDDTSPPVFNQTEYNIIIQEELPVSTHVVTVAAYTSDNADIVYSIVEGTNSNNFNISTETGDVYIVFSLDRETQISYTVKVSAKSLSNNLISMATININLTDINDNSPIFSNDSTSFTLYENAAIGTYVGTVEAYDTDEGPNGTIGSYAIHNNTELFSIDSATGNITLTGVGIDREVTEIEYILVIATDMGNIIERTGTTIITINILDVNDNPPLFDRNYTLSVPEDTLTNTLLVTFNATDVDQGDNSVVEYTLLDNNSPFVTTNNQLRLNKQLDYEITTVYELTVLANDKGNPPLSDTTYVTVYVTDVDDLPPYFETAKYFASVLENSVNTPFTQVLALDDDTVHDVAISYSILNESSPFAIDSISGELSVIISLDREVQDSYVITVQANGHPSPPATAQVIIEVTDVNDFTPTFSSTLYNFTISELTPINSSIGMISVLDNDLLNNGEIASVYIDNVTSVFILDETTLTLFVNAELDYEQTTHYSFTVVAIDGGDQSLTGSTMVAVYLTDENDNTPYIQTNITTLYITEDIDLFTTIVTIEATDSDSDGNGMIEFSLTGGEPFIVINDTTGKIYITDVITPGNYSLTVTASDLGTPVRDSSLSFTVIVLDINKKPVFTSGITDVSVEEDETIGTIVTTVVATDPDQNADAELAYYLSNSDGFFEISIATGDITLLKVIDRELNASFDLIVSVIDSGVPPSTASASLEIIIGDVNDNRPVFSQPGGYSTEIIESASIGTTIIIINATDADVGTNGQITYILSFFDLSLSGLLEIENSGAIIIEEALDREMYETIEVTVRAFDGGQPSLSKSTVVNIDIIDADDNPPVFIDSQYSTVVMENATIGTYLVNVSAQDIDMGNNGIVRYRLVTHSDVPFTIDSESGIINISSPGLDREMNASYSLIVEAYNPFSNTHTATTTVTIQVTDVNDNYPVFIPTNMFDFNVEEDSNINDIIGSVVAVDTDEGDNSELVYKFTSPSETFNINSITGELSLKKKLDFEKNPGPLVFEITVSDNGFPTLSSNATVSVNIVNVNDNAPLVTTSTNQFEYIEETASINIGIGINITDLDNLVIHSATIELKLVDETPVSEQDFISISQLSSPILSLQESTGHYIVINGPATTSVFTDTLRYIQFGSTSIESSINTRIVSVQVNDGLFDSDTLNISINIVTVNDNAPVIDFGVVGDTVSVEYTEDKDGDLSIVPEDTVIVDADSGTNLIVNGSATLLMSPINAMESISAQSTDRITAVQISPFEIQFTGEASLNEFSLVLKTITYTVADDNPLDVATTRIVELAVNDGLFDSALSYIHITIIPSNDPPSLSVKNQILNYTEESTFLSVFGDDLILVDVDSPELSYIDILLVNEMDNIELLSYMTDDTNITVQSSGSGALRLIGSASLDDFTTVLMTLEYSNTDIANTPGSRRIQITLFDGIDSSDLFEIIITFSAINDPPIVDLNGNDSLGLQNSVSFTEEGEPIQIAPKATIIDVDSVNIISARITLTNQPDSDHEMLMVSSNTTLVYNYDITTGELNIIGEASVEVYQQLLRSVLYSNTNSDPTFDNRVVSVTVSDTNSSHSSIVHTTINIIEINDPPVLNINGTDNVYTEGGPAINFIESAEIIDVDNDEFVALHVNILNAENIEFEGIDGSLVDGLSSNYKDIGTVKQYSFQLTDKSTENFENLFLSLKYFNNALEPTNTKRELQVYIDDGENTSPYVTLQISIVLVNDESPQFISSNKVMVLEDTPLGTDIYTTMATDSDFDSIISYTIVYSDVPISFSIDSVTGVVNVTGTLDRESVASYSVAIIANDSVNTGQLNLSIVLEDVNDNPPVFSKEEYVIFVYENESIGEVILIMNTTDADVGVNAQIQYELVQQNDIFSIDYITGVLTLNVLLDFESTVTHNVTVIASGDSNINSASALIVVNIGNVNDNEPIFEAVNEFVNVSENAAIGSVILSATATDPDGYDVSYMLLDDEDLFGIDKTSGDVRLLQMLDREMVENHTITVIATDSQYPVQSSEMMFTILVDDVDDNPPVFEKQFYEINITENVALGVAVLNLEWSDEDDGINAQATLVISSGNTGDSFTIDSNGELLVNGDIDRETVSMYSLIVTVSGSLNPAFNDSALVNITVLDENDYPPTFNNSTIRFLLNENSPIGVIVGIVQAIDKDTAPNAMLTYSFAGNVTDAFILDTTNGTIKVNESIDLESIVLADYTLEVVAVDSGKPQLQGSIEVVIEIQDINEYIPNFTLTEGAFGFNENSPIDTVVKTITAKDMDYSSVLTFSIQEPVDGFDIDPTNGKLTTTKLFNFENDTTEFTIQLVVTDNGQPQQFSSTLNIIIFVEDVNEFAPVFTEQEYSASLLENTTIDSTILQVRTTDKDSGDAGIVSYELIGYTPKFNITDEGYLILSDKLDRESVDTYNFSIKSFNHFADNMALTGSVSVSITVIDVNDNGPVFSMDSLSTVVYNTIGVGSSVYIVEATDEDIGDNAIVRYSLSDQSVFSIDENEGIIRVATEILSEGIYTLLVTAENIAPPEYSDSITITITVIAPYSVTFSNNGPGFLTDIVSDTSVTLDMFINELYDSTGRVSAELGDTSVTEEFTIAQSPAVSVEGTFFNMIKINNTVHS